MIQIPDPPSVAACSTCMQPLLWLYSARTSRWVAFIPGGGEHTIRPHLCREPAGWPSWRQARRGTAPNETYRAAKAALQERTGEQPDLHQETT